MSGILFTILSILLFVAILSALVIAHEFGHFWVAKKSGIRVDEFGLGYPPRAKTLFMWKGTLFTLNWLPFGGFVKIFGEDGSNVGELTQLEKDQSFVTKPRYTQAAVLVAGVVMNFLVGWLLVSGLYMKGTPIIFDDAVPAQYLSDTKLIVETVVPGAPADIAHLATGDIITKVSHTKGETVLETYTPKSLTAFIRASEGKALSVEILREGKAETLGITPTLNKDTQVYMIGITPTLTGYIKLPFFDAIVQGFDSSVSLVRDTVQGILGLATQKVSIDAVSGPVGMVGMVGTAATMGIDYVILFAALISLSLAVINLVPFPALDGGRLVFVVVEAIIRRPIPANITAILNTVGFFLLIGLMLFVTYHDVVRLIVR